MRVFKQVFTGRGLDDSDEPFRYRTAMILLALSVVGVLIWSQWMGLRGLPMLVWFGFMLLMGFVSMKIRAECGTPFAWFVPQQSVVFVGLVGGVHFFKPDGFVFVTYVSMLLVSAFFFIPGLQLEMLQIGRKAMVNSRHILIATLLGVLGGFFIGGWAYLGNCYSLGVDGAGNKFPYTQRRVEFKEYTKQMSIATSSLESGEMGSPRNPAKWAIIYAAVGTTLVAVLRQLFAGFWFHPVGIVLGPSMMLTYTWGSILFALAIRYLVLKLGGAVSVRDRLLPFAVGIFLASVAAYVVLFLYSGYLLFFQSGALRATIVF